MPPHVVAMSAAASAFALVAALAIFLRVPRARRWRPLLVLSALSVPGLVAMFALRADAPARAGGTAQAIASLESSMHEHALAHGCATVARNDCEACQPIVRFALAAPGECTSTATVEIGAMALQAGHPCITDGDVLRCGMP